MKNGIVAIVECSDDGEWLVSAPSIHYHAQGDTRAEAIRLFEDGFDEAVEWARESGVNPTRARQPEILEYAL